MLYQNIADEEITAGESASFIIAQLKAFGTEFEKIGDVGSQAVYVIDAVNEVSNTNAVSSAQLAESLGKVSATLSANNVKFSESLGMLTAITEISRNANTASRGLKMISSRLVQINDEASSTGKKLREIYDGLGINVYDVNGQLRSTYDILKDLSKQWGDLDTNTQQYIALTSSGANQIQNFYALMSNFSTAIDATATAEKSMGSAWKENERYMESVEAKYQSLKTAIENLVLGDGGITKLIKGVLELSTNFVNFANSAGGVVTIITALTTALILLNTSGFSKFYLSLITSSKATKEASASFMAYVGSLLTGKTALQKVEVQAVETAGALSLATAGITILLGVAVTVITTLIRKNKEYNESIQENINSLSLELDKYESLKKSLSDESLTRSQLNDLIKGTSLEYNSELRSIGDVNEAREKSIQLIEEEKRKLAEETVQKGVEAYNKAKDKLGDSYSVRLLRPTTDGGAFSAIREKGLFDNEYSAEISANNLNEYIYKLKEAIYTVNEYGTSSGDAKETLKELNSALLEAESLLEENQKIINDYNNALLVAGYRYDEVDGKLIELTDSQKVYAQVQSELSKVGIDNYNVIKAVAEEVLNTGASIEDVVAKYDDLSNSMFTSSQMAEQLYSNGAITEEQFKALIEVIAEDESGMLDFEEACEQVGITLDENGDVIDRFAEKMEEWNSSMDSIQSSYEALQNAVDEYNSSQMYSLDTVQALLNLDPEYLSMLEMTEHGLRLNEQALKDKAEALINDGKAEIYAEGSRRLAELATKSSTETTKKSIAILEAETDALANNSAEKARNARATFYKNVATDKYGGANKDAVNEIVRDVENQIRVLDSAVASIGVSFNKSMTTTATATQKAKEETNALKDEVNGLKNAVQALEDELDKYETVISTINDALDDEIERIETERDEKLDSIEKQIDAIEELQDKEEEYWDAKIQALQDENSAIEEQIELQTLLDALNSAKSNKVKVYREGQGFVWETDQDAVGKAQQAIDEYNRKKYYNDRLKELEDYKNQALSKYEAQINDLKKYSENQKAEYDKQIKYYESVKTSFNNQVKEYENSQNRLLVLQMTGIDLEQSNWTERLGNLNSFVDKYKAKLQELENAQKAMADAEAKLNSASSTSSNSSSNSGVGGNSNTTNTSTPITHYYVDGKEVGQDEYLVEKGKANQENAKYEQAKKQKGLTQTQINRYDDFITKNNNRFSTKTYAKGVSSVKSNEFAIVGENPNKELIIGSSLNGVGMQLKKGTGVVNAKSTSTLAGLFNMIGNQFSKASLGEYNMNNNTTNNSASNIHIDTINLPEVHNASEFIEKMQNFSNSMAQKAYSAI